MQCSERRATIRRLLLATVALAALGTSVASAAENAKGLLSIWEQETLTGDWGGARTALKEKNGVDVTLNYIGETFAVLSGGLQRRGSYEGRFEFSLDADLQKLVGWDGGGAHVTVYQIHNIGHTTAADNVGSLADPSNIDALATTRLFTAWLEQNFNDRFAVRVGQLAADDEFIVSPTAGGLINGTFGWAGVLAANMLNGGPAYPLATPGVRVKAMPTEELSIFGRGVLRRSGGQGLQRQSAGLQSPRHHLQLFRRRAVDGRNAIRDQSGKKAAGCRASTSSAPGTRSRILPTSVSLSTARAPSSHWPIRRPPVRSNTAAIGASMASPIRWSGASTSRASICSHARVWRRPTAI